MLSIDTLKSFISHPDRLVREKIMNYIYRGNIKDPEILPMALNAYEKYDDPNSPKNLYLLYHCSNQYIDDISAEKLFEMLQGTDDESAEMHIAFLLCNANLPWLEKNIAKLKSHSSLDFSSADSRLEIIDCPPMQLWDRLKEYAGQCDKDREMYSDRIVAPIIEALASHLFPDDDTVCELLLLERGRDRYMEVFLVKLAGERRLKQAIPLICDMLTDKDSNADEWCIGPLSLIGSVEVVDILKENFLQQSWSYQLTAMGILGYIKSPESEQAIIELLARKDGYQEDVYYHLCFALCDQLSEKAIDFCTPLIDEPEACQIGSFREELLAISQIHGLDLPQAAEWRQQVEDDYERQFRFKSEFGKMAADFRERLDQIESQKRIAEFNEVLRESDHGRRVLSEIEDYDPPIFHPKLEPSDKVGRNEPCPCDSGKKYKKCCGANK